MGVLGWYKKARKEVTESLREMIVLEMSPKTKDRKDPKDKQEPKDTRELKDQKTQKTQMIQKRKAKN